MSQSSVIIQRVIAGLFVALAIANFLIAVALVARAGSGFEYLAFGVGALLWIAAGAGFLLAASSVMKPSDRWWVFALAAAATSKFLSIFVLPTLFAHVLLDAAVVVGVIRWLRKQSTSGHEQSARQRASRGANAPESTELT